MTLTLNDGAVKDRVGAEIRDLKPQRKELTLVLPLDLHGFISKFLIDRHTGNVILNVKDGCVRGCRLEFPSKHSSIGPAV